MDKVDMKLEMHKVSPKEFHVKVGENLVGFIVKDFNNWYGYFDKDEPIRAKHEAIVFVEMNRIFNRFKLVGSNDKAAAEKVLENLMVEARKLAKELNALGETETFALNKVLI